MKKRKEFVSGNVKVWSSHDLIKTENTGEFENLEKDNNKRVCGGLGCDCERQSLVLLVENKRGSQDWPDSHEPDSALAPIFY